MRSVGLVPAELTGVAFDDNVLRTTPGLYPDPLYPLEDGVIAFPGQWRSVWGTGRLPRGGLAGKDGVGL